MILRGSREYFTAVATLCVIQQPPVGPWGLMYGVHLHNIAGRCNALLSFGFAGVDELKLTRTETVALYIASVSNTPYVGHTYELAVLESLKPLLRSEVEKIDQRYDIL